MHWLPRARFYGSLRHSGLCALSGLSALSVTLGGTLYVSVLYRDMMSDVPINFRVAGVTHGALRQHFPRLPGGGHW